MNGLRLTRLVCAGQLRGLSTGWARGAAWLTAAVCAGILVASSAAGDLLRWALSPQVADSAGGVLLVTLANTWLADGCVPLTSMVLVAVFAGALFPALTSPAPPALRSDELRAGLRWTITSRFAESWLAGLVSVIPLMQLAALTALASIAAVDTGSHARAVAVAWASWVVMSSVSQAAVWWACVARIRPLRHGVVYLAVGAAVLLGGVAATWPSARALWGAARWYIRQMNQTPLPVVLAGATVAAVGFAWLGRAGCSLMAGRIPPQRARGTRRARTLPSGAFAATVACTARSAWRNRQVRTPVVALWLIVAALASVAGPTPQVVAVTCLGLPLTWSLAFTRNFLSVTGRAGTWLVSTPAGASRILGAGSLVAAGGAVLLPVAAWTPALAAGRMSLAGAGSVLAVAACAGSATTASSLLFAVRHPEAVSCTGRSPLLSTGRTASGTVRLLAPALLGYVAATGGAALVDSSAAPGGWAVTGGVAACLVCAGAVHWWTWRTWSRPQVSSTALAVAGAVG